MIPVYIFFSVIFGALLSRFFISHNKGLKMLITFSGSFMLGITLLEIFPEHVYQSPTNNLGIWVLLGVFIQLLLETATKGIEHGHYHSVQGRLTFLVLFIGLLIHSILEGLPGELAGENYALAIIVHKIPVAIILGVFLLKSHTPWYIQMVLVLIYALSTPIAYYIGDFFRGNYTDYFMAIVSGIFLHISSTIIFESTEKHHIKISRFIMIVLGFTIAYISSALES